MQTNFGLNKFIFDAYIKPVIHVKNNRYDHTFSNLIYDMIIITYKYNIEMPFNSTGIVNIIESNIRQNANIELLVQFFHTSLTLTIRPDDYTKFTQFLLKSKLNAILD